MGPPFAIPSSARRARPSSARLARTADSFRTLSLRTRVRLLTELQQSGSVPAITIEEAREAKSPAEALKTAKCHTLSEIRLAARASHELLVPLDVASGLYLSWTRARTRSAADSRLKRSSDTPVLSPPALDNWNMAEGGASLFDNDLPVASTSSDEVPKLRWAQTDLPLDPASSSKMARLNPPPRPLPWPHWLVGVLCALAGLLLLGGVELFTGYALKVTFVINPGPPEPPYAPPSQPPPPSLPAPPPRPPHAPFLRARGGGEGGYMIQKKILTQNIFF